MKTKLLIILLVISLGINAGVIFAFGFRHWHAKRLRPEFRRERLQLQRSLDLSEEQNQLFEKYRKELNNQLSPLREKIRQKRRELLGLLKTEEIDEEKIDKLLSEIAELQSEIEKTVVRHSIQIRKILTPAQQKKFIGFLEQQLFPKERQKLPTPPVRRR